MSDRRFPPLVRHDPPMGDEDKESILGSPANWFDKGSDLYETAVLVRDQLTSTHYGTTCIVGRPVWTRCGSSNEEHRLLHRESIAIMLFAMAVECWLKGLLIRSIPREQSRHWRESADRLLDEELAAGGFEESEWLAKLLEAMNKPEIESALNAQTAASRAENSDRARLVARHGGHNLRKLATSIQCAEAFREDQFEFLDLLSMAIQMGRYPMHNQPKAVIPWAEQGLEVSRWDDLCETIFTIYMERRFDR